MYYISQNVSVESIVKINSDRDIDFSREAKAVFALTTRVEIKPDLPGLNSVSARPHLTRIDASQVHAAVHGSVYSTSTRAS